MNRDERRERHENGVYSDANHVYPVDKQSGGSWCGVNANGLGLTLLNRYQDDMGSGTISRGGIVPQVLQASTLKQAYSIVSGLELRFYNPFTLLIISATEAGCFSWNGRIQDYSLISVAPWSMRTSSSWQTMRVLARRQQRFDRWSKAATAAFGVVPDLHLNQTRWRKSEAVLMERAESHTKSICQFSLGKERTQFNYFDQIALQQLVLDSQLPATHTAQLPISSVAI